MNIAIDKYSREEPDQALQDIDRALQETVQELIDQTIEYHDSGYGDDKAEPIEFRSRSGFIPHSFNHGGYGKHLLTGFWSGGFNTPIQTQIDKYLAYAEECGREEFGDAYDPSTVAEHSEWEQQFLSDCDMFYFECRVMYHGIDSEGTHSATLSLIARVSDAPYFRYADWYGDATIEFKDASELRHKTQTNDVVKKLLAASVHTDENWELNC